MRSQPPGLTRFSYEHKLNFICVNKGHADLTHVSILVGWAHMNRSHGSKAMHIPDLCNSKIFGWINDFLIWTAKAIEIKWTSIWKRVLMKFKTSIQIFLIVRGIKTLPYDDMHSAILNIHINRWICRVKITTRMKLFHIFSNSRVILMLNLIFWLLSVLN